MIPIPASWMEGEGEKEEEQQPPSSLDPWLNLLQQSLRQSFLEDEDEIFMEEESEKLEWDKDDVLHYAAPKQHFSMPPSNSNSKKKARDNNGNSSTSSTGTGSKLEHMLENIYEAMNVARGHAKHIKLQELNLDTVLSAMPYRAMMQSCFGHEHIMQQGKKNEEASAKWLADIPNVTRSFEEKFMREPMPNSNERQCAQVKPFPFSHFFPFSFTANQTFFQGAQCECRFIDPMKPFIAMEFLTLEELYNPPAHPQLCVVCSRKQTQFLYYDMVFNKVCAHFKLHAGHCVPYNSVI